RAGRPRAHLFDCAFSPWRVKHLPGTDRLTPPPPPAEDSGGRPERRQPGEAPMKSAGWAGTLVVLLGVVSTTPAFELCGDRLQRVNGRLHGRVVGYKHNHGADHPNWSPALNQHRDLYVYLPPGYSPCRSYPLLIWLHGFVEDEHAFLKDVVEHFDRAIARGQLPPLIIAAPDGSILGRPSFHNSASFYLNSRA